MKINIGDRVICTVSGVIGKVIRFYTPTSCEEQIMVLTDDGRKYHAPTNTWRLTNIVIPNLPIHQLYSEGFITEIIQKREGGI